MTVTCNAVPTNPITLQYDNGVTGICQIQGVAVPTQTGSFDECGGSLTFQWIFTDACNRTIQHQQVITVEPTPEAAFINPPSPTSVDCSMVPLVPPTLSYTNGVLGQCSINGTVAAIQSGNFDECGGSITYSWVFTDGCNRVISHSQIVTVTPAPDPVFVNPPQNMIIDCGVAVPPPTPLALSLIHI